MSAEVEIVGGAGDYEAAAIVAAIQAIFFEEDARAKQLTTTSRWRIELKRFEPGRWGLERSTAPPEDL